MEISYLPININNIQKRPDKFKTNLSDQDYIFEIFYNPVGKYFSFNLYDEDEKPIIFGRRITYGTNMLGNVIKILDIKIYPLDKTDQAEKIGITLENFMTSVKPYIVG